MRIPETVRRLSRQAAFAFIAWALAVPSVASSVVAGAHRAASPQEKNEDKKSEAFKIQKLTQGLGLYAIGPVSPDGKSVLLLAQKPQQSPNLYLMNLTDHSIRPPLTALKWGVSNPAWSPDGQMIAMAGASEVAAFPEIYVLELTSGKMRQLTRNAFSDKEPVFTPNGKKILYSSDESPLPDAAFGILHVAAMPVGGGKAEYFTYDEASSLLPGISADEKSVLLVKVSDATGRHSLWQYSFEGKPLRDLTETKFARIRSYRVIKGTQTIVLSAQEQAEQQDQVYLLDSGSGKITELPDPDLIKRNPSVSPDGKLIVFLGAARNGAQLFLYDISSGELKQLTHKGFNNHTPVFASNTTILFGSDREKEDNNELYLLDLEQQSEEKKKR